MILGGLCTVLAVGSVQFLGQERIVSYDSCRCVAASSEALAWLTKAKCERINHIFTCRYTASETLSVSISSLATIQTIYSRALGGSEISY